MAIERIFPDDGAFQAPSFFPLTPEVVDSDVEPASERDEQMWSMVVERVPNIDQYIQEEDNWICGPDDTRFILLAPIAQLVNVEGKTSAGGKLNARINTWRVRYNGEVVQFSDEHTRQIVADLNPGKKILLNRLYATPENVVRLLYFLTVDGSIGDCKDVDPSLLPGYIKKEDKGDNPNDPLSAEERQQQIDHFEQVAASFTEADLARLEAAAIQAVDQRFQEIEAKALKKRPGTEQGVLLDGVNLYLNHVAPIPELEPDEQVGLARLYEVGHQAKKKLRKAKLCEAGHNTRRKLDKLSRHEADTETIRDLLHHIQVGNRARHFWIQANSGLVTGIAKRYVGCGVPFLDLIQEGNLGLMKAIEKYDYHRGFQFSTYATRHIFNAVTRSIGENGRAVRLPIDVAVIVKSLNEISLRLHQQDALIPDYALLAEAYNDAQLQAVEKGKKKLENVQFLTAEDAQLYFERSRASIPLETEDEDTLSMLERHPDLTFPDPQDATANSLRRKHLIAILNRMQDPRRRDVVVAYYGLDGQDPRTFAQIGEALEMTGENARILHSKAKAELETFDDLPDLLD